MLLEIGINRMNKKNSLLQYFLLLCCLIILFSSIKNFFNGEVLKGTIKLAISILLSIIYSDKSLIS